MNYVSMQPIFQTAKQSNTANCCPSSTIGRQVTKEHIRIPPGVNPPNATHTNTHSVNSPQFTSEYKIAVYANRWFERRTDLPYF